MIWKEIPIYETERVRYEASDCGKIRSILKSSGKISIMSQSIQSGYLNTTIAGKPVDVHVVVALAHIPRPLEADDTWSVDHIDPHDKLNNSVMNLRWSTRKDQSLNQRPRSRTAINSCPVIGISIDSGEILKFNSLETAASYIQGHSSNISNCLNGNLKSCKGYMWSPPISSPNLPNEEWKCVGSTIRYKLHVSNCGRVGYEFNTGYFKKVSSHDKITQRIVEENDGYPSITIGKKRCGLHRLIWETFMGPIPNGMIIHHKDHDKRNACLENLELVSSKDNTWAAHDAGRFDGKSKCRQSVSIDGVEYVSINNAAKQLGVPYSTIRNNFNLRI
jgi:hypothetical protein